METKIKKIAVIGPESTGKSTLCEQLAAHYKTAWVKEYAREYLEKNGADYKFEDLYKIAEGQIGAEQQALSEMNYELRITNYERDPNNNELPNSTLNTHDSTLLFIDTDLYVIKVWSEFVFNKIDSRILTAIAGRKYDLYLLCDIDLPWVADELREYPDPAVRKKLFHYYKEEMIEQNVPWIIVRGNYEERLKKAIEAVGPLTPKGGT